jgi:predicted helicase
MPAYPHLQRYRADLQRFIDFGGSDNEQSIRRAFAVCLDAYCRDHREKLALVDELDADPGARVTGSRNRPDGTVKDSLRMTRGYWEAKDSHDDLDAEIQAKFNRGYPRDNILFEDSRTAVLFQNGAETMRVDMARPGDLHHLIRRFLDYQLPQIDEFRQARQQFKADLPAVLESLREAVADAEAHNPDYQRAAAVFLALCRQTISPEVSDADVREMLLQHILTRDIFLRVFAEDQFHRENNVARQLAALEQTFFTGDVRRQAIDRLRAYYGAIGRAADEIAEHAEKQQFLKAVYEDFYKAYNPAAADRLGVVYTPNEVVDFIIRGADHLLRKHFGKSLADDNVQILDPATGTGTFVTSLIDYLPPERLEHKYRHEIHANEVAILPYYIANLNIEYSYREKTGRYLEFPNLCFVDTLDNMDWQQSGATGGAVTRQAAFNLGGLSEENWIRVQEQNEKPISVIIGNPPYNDSQSNWNEFNPNRQYLEIDRRIRETYVKEGTAQKTHQYDMYKRFLRWASDRLDDDGIIAFITNRAYLDARQDDGFRKIAADEFTDIYVLDLGSDVRRNPKISGTTHNVFGIQTGVAIGFFVRDKSRSGQCNIRYARREDAETAADKLAYLCEAAMQDIDFDRITPDEFGQWLNQSVNRYRFRQLMPLADKQAKLARNPGNDRAVFGLFANGAKSNRDEWVYDFDVNNLRRKALFFTDVYNGLLDSGEESYDPAIKWSSTLRDRLHRNERIIYNDARRIESLYRPFVLMHHFTDAALNDRLTRNHYEIFGPDLKQPNKVICFSGVASSKPFQVLATDKLFGFDTLEKTQCLPLYRYTAEGQRVSNVTEWGLRQFREHYGDDSITAEDIFAYVYAVLHDPAYRQRYEVDLRREFPRLHFQDDFAWWAQQGQALLDLHLGFESAEPYPLERAESGLPGRPILRADKERGSITLDGKTTLTGIPESAWRYRLGSRSALEWVLDQYKERKPRDPTIAEKFNTYRFADYKEQVIDLLARVCTVSVATIKIVDYELDVWTNIDPDEGLEFKEEFLQEMERRLASNEPTIPAEEVYRRLGLV